MAFRVVLIGASGVFGSRIAQQLAGEARFALTIAGRNGDNLLDVCAKLGKSNVARAILDARAPGFEQALAALQPQLVIHAAGPFQHQDYRVAQACLECGSHYLDLADAREFVCGIGALDEHAKKHGLLLTSGASTLPAISSAVVDALLPQFARLDRIEHAISPGNRTARGDATVAAILGYCGRKIPLWRERRWQYGYGWMMSKRVQFGFARRWVGLCDVPDLTLFPARYPTVRDVIFRAGLELKRLHAGTWLAAALVRAGLVRDLTRHAPRLRHISEWFLHAGTDVGGMLIELRGIDLQAQPMVLRWSLVAAVGDGPMVPATPAVVLARKLADGELTTRGAMPCMGLFSLDEVACVWRDFNIETRVEATTT